MSLFDDGHFLWRETYFVLFDTPRRPMLDAFLQRLQHCGTRFEARSPIASPEGRIESVCLVAPDDGAGVDVCFRNGADIAEESLALIDELQASLELAGGKAVETKLRHADGRFDVLHFGRVDETPCLDDPDEQIDPNAVLLVLETLASLTAGVAIDPQGGVVLL